MQAERRTGERMELVVFVGLQGSGKSGYFSSRYAGTHVHVSKDLFPRHARRKSERQLRQIEQALATGRSAVVDNTNPRRADRAPLIEAGKRAGARVIAVHFLASVGEALRRNAAREGRARVPDVAIYTAARRLEPPLAEEGFDEIVRVRLGDDGFALEPAPA
ncbi:MAG TPA: ATP-binding protein [Myxococcales bacterium]|jgi:predicted kinase|nr:ATP-binding protein [Myxococcales bacterium]